MTAKKAKQRLYKLEDVPKHLQFNKDILTGYRGLMNGKECVHSLTYLHNESFNCYSHGFALLYFLFSTRDYWTVWPTLTTPTSNNVKLFILGDLIATIVPFLLSIIYHTFMPHLGGERVYKQLLKLDIFGVWWACSLGPISYSYTGFYCSPILMVLYFTMYSLFSMTVLYYLMVVDCKKKRVGALTAQFFLRILLHPLRLSSLSNAAVTSVYYYMVMDVISAVGALVNAHHIPERWFPGKLDYVLNGHTLMHMAALLSLAIGRQGFLSDMKWLNTVQDCPNVTHSGMIWYTEVSEGLMEIIGTKRFSN